VRERLMQRIGGSQLKYEGRPVSTRATAAGNRWLGVGLAASLILAVGLAIIASVEHNKARNYEAALGPMQDEVAAAKQALLTKTHQLEAAEAELTATRDNAARNGQQLAAVRRQLGEAHDLLRLAGDPAVSFASLKGDKPQPDAGGRILIEAKDQTWHLIATHLKDPGKDRTYELWFIPAGKSPVRAGTFNPDEQGMAMLTVKVPAELGPIAVAAVTNEPAGGSDTPTMPIHMVGQLQ